MMKAVIFDLDGVITDTAEFHYKAWKKIADELGIPFDASYNEKLKGVSRMESLCLILDNGPGRDSFTLEEKEKYCDKKNEIYKKQIKGLTPDDVLPGIKDFMQELKKNHILIGLASVSKNAPEIIDRLEIDDLFDYMADARVIKNSKPEPDVFIDNLINLEVDSFDAIGIEDAESGIEAIHRAGMKAVGIGDKAILKNADIVLSSTRELSFQKMNSL